MGCSWAEVVGMIGKKGAARGKLGGRTPFWNHRFGNDAIGGGAEVNFDDDVIGISSTFIFFTGVTSSLVIDAGLDDGRLEASPSDDDILRSFTTGSRRPFTSALDASFSLSLRVRSATAARKA